MKNLQVKKLAEQAGIDLEQSIPYGFAEEFSKLIYLYVAKRISNEIQLSNYPEIGLILNELQEEFDI